jgi:hypothetical protein
MAQYMLLQLAVHAFPKMSLLRYTHQTKALALQPTLMVGAVHID